MVHTSPSAVADQLIGMARHAGLLFVRPTATLYRLRLIEPLLGSEPAGAAL